MKLKDRWMALLSVFIVIFFFDFFDYDNQLYHYFFPLKPYYDLSWWDMFGAIGSVGAAYMAWRANEAIKKQLEIEQEPYVVLDGRISIIEKIEGQPEIEAENLKDNLLIKIKNIGRGPAIRVTVTSLKNDSEKALFEATEPHSIDLSDSESKTDWKLDINNLKTLIKEQLGEVSFEELLLNQKSIFLYIHFFDQMMKRKNIVKTRLVMTDSGIIYGGRKYFLKVMENERLEPTL